MFTLKKQSSQSGARLGLLTTAHGKVETPVFMTVATHGVVKHLTTEELRELEVPIILANTYHLLLNPGIETLKQAGGLHHFMNWEGPILTDSGGFQVFSLTGRRIHSHNLVKLTADGVYFNSPRDGRRYYLTPELSLDMQVASKVDIAVALDECLALPASVAKVRQSVERTTAWAKRAKAYYLSLPEPKPLLFGVIQGGVSRKWREQSLSEVVALDFDGYNIGGLSVGETTAEMYEVLEWLEPLLPHNKTRYLMGVGYPDNIVEAVRRGVDMFDCVIPTREGRHGRLFFWQPDRHFIDETGRVREFYQIKNIRNSSFAQLDEPINPYSRLPILRSYSLSYLHYLYKIGEPLGCRLASLNNLEFYYDLMALIREAIKNNEL